MFLSALQSLIPPLFAVVLQNAPFTSTAKLHGDIPAIEGRTPREWNIYVVIFWRSTSSEFVCCCWWWWCCSDPVPQASFSPPGRGDHHRQQRDAECAAAPLRPPARARGNHQLGQPAMGCQSIVSNAITPIICWKIFYMMLQRHA